MTAHDTGMASVQKAFALLDVVAADPRGATAKDISAELGMPLSQNSRTAPCGSGSARTSS